MAEIRKHDPDAGDGLGRLVREALGETVRPIEPGGAKPPASAQTPADPGPDPAVALPNWPDGEGLTFRF